MSILDKIRALSEEKRKAILWTTVVILSLLLLWWWLEHVGKVVRNVSTEKLKEQFTPPVFNTNVPKLNISLPNLQEISNSELESLKKELSPEELEQLKLLENNIENNKNTENGNQQQ